MALKKEGELASRTPIGYQAVDHSQVPDDEAALAADAASNFEAAACLSASSHEGARGSKKQERSRAAHGAGLNLSSPVYAGREILLGSSSTHFHLAACALSATELSFPSNSLTLSSRGFNTESMSSRRTSRAVWNAEASMATLSSK